MAEDNVIDMAEAQQRLTDARNGAGPQIVADGTDIAVASGAAVPVPALVIANEAHVMDVLITTSMGAAVGFLAGKDMGSTVIGALGGAAFGLAEKALLGPRAGVAPDSRIFYAVAALGTTIGAGFLSFQR